MSAKVLPIAAKLGDAERSELIETLEHYRSMGNEWIKRQVIENDRIDILAAILGFTLKPFHVALLQFQFQHDEGLILAFRGAGKSTMCTIVKAIHYLLKDPNLRIVIVSKTTSNASDFLIEIKEIFESHERFKEIFGVHYNPRKGRWNDKEIDVCTKTHWRKEASITCTGPEGTVVGSHFDIEFCDDLVDEDNSRTQHMRDRITKWYGSILEPTIEPPSPDNPLIGKRHKLGTHYHFDDQYKRWIKQGMPYFVIPALSDEGQSPWPEKWPVEEIAKRRAKIGMIIFNAQYQCNTDAMKGEVFQFDDCIVVENSDVPWDDLDYYQGVDLAISQKDQADNFAIVVIGVDRIGNIYVVDFYEGKLRFGAQTRKIAAYAMRHKPTRVGLETVAYQDAQAQVIADGDIEEGSLPPETRLRKINTGTDKMTRGWKLSPLFEDKRVHFLKSCLEVRDQLVLFPNYRYKDLFDAFDLAVSSYRGKGRRKRRDYEPGII